MSHPKSLLDFASSNNLKIVKSKSTLRLWDDERILFTLWKNDNLFEKTWKWSVTWYKVGDLVGESKLDVGNIISAIKLMKRKMALKPPSGLKFGRK